MHRCAFSITLPFGSIRRSPVVVIGAQRGTVPCTLLEHLRNRSVVEIEPMLNGVATTVEGAMQSNSAIGVASDFFPPAMSFVDDGFQFFDRQGRLRNQFAIFSHPRTVGHVNLD